MSDYSTRIDCRNRSSGSMPTSTHFFFLSFFYPILFVSSFASFLFTYSFVSFFTSLTLLFFWLPLLFFFYIPICSGVYAIVSVVHINSVMSEYAADACYGYVSENPASLQSMIRLERNQSMQSIFLFLPPLLELRKSWGKIIRGNRRNKFLLLLSPTW